jgi:lambda family phage tail tape measure protein
MATIENFLLKFKVDGQQAVTGASNAVKGLSDQVGKLGASTGMAGDALGGLIGKLGPIGAAAGAAALAFAGLGLRAIQLADEIGDISDATGISAGALLNFKTSLVEAGGKAEDFANLASRLNQSVGEAADGNEKLQKTFKTLGVFVTDAGGNIRSTEVILRDAIARLAAIEDPARRAALATDLFGKAAATLDFTKLNAFKDPVADADIKRLAEYQAAIDRVRTTLERKLISFFGSVAEEIEKAGARARAEEERLNKIGISGRPHSNAVGLYGGPVSGIYTPEGGIGTRRMTAEEKAAFAERQRIAQMERLMAPAAGKPRWSEPQAPGGFGKPSEGETKANAKALADWETRLQLSTNQTKLQEDLRSANQIQTISLNAAADMERARLEIYARERLTKQQKDMEFAEKEIEISAKAATDIAKIRAQTNARTFAEEEAQREENRKAIADQEEAYRRGAMNAQEQINNFKLAREEQEKRYQLEKDLQGVDEITATMRRNIFNLEEQRAQQIRSMSNMSNLAYSERLKLEQQINSEIDRAILLERQRAGESLANQNNFSYGWNEALKKYAATAKTTSEQAADYFNTFSRGFEDAIVNFVKTGKLSFKDLVNTMIAEFARIQAQKLLLNLFGNNGGDGNILTTLFAFGKSFFGMSAGGVVGGGNPYIVGERGPEMFLPFTDGRIVPNNQLRGGAVQPIIQNVNYTIQAVDASSFRQLVARDPSFIHAVAERGRQSQPTRRVG